MSGDQYKLCDLVSSIGFNHTNSQVKAVNRIVYQNQ